MSDRSPQRTQHWRRRLLKPAPPLQMTSRRSQHPLPRQRNPERVPSRRRKQRGRRRSPDHGAEMKWSKSSQGQRTRMMRTTTQVHPNLHGHLESPWPRLLKRSLPSQRQVPRRVRRWQRHLAKAARRHLLYRCCWAYTMRLSWRRRRLWLRWLHPWRYRALRARRLSCLGCHHPLQQKKLLALGRRLWLRHQRGLLSPRRRCLV